MFKHDYKQLNVGPVFTSSCLGDRIFLRIRQFFFVLMLGWMLANFATYNDYMNQIIHLSHQTDFIIWIARPNTWLGVLTLVYLFSVIYISREVEAAKVPSETFTLISWNLFNVLLPFSWIFLIAYFGIFQILTDQVTSGVVICNFVVMTVDALCGNHSGEFRHVVYSTVILCVVLLYIHICSYYFGIIIYPKMDWLNEPEEAWNTQGWILLLQVMIHPSFAMFFYLRHRRKNFNAYPTHTPL